ncbi:hypothetical protein [Rhizobium sp. 2MFCol3.1]|uniref:hypothetical protein n=1 Tax=Rhizobium sp. 2MFCol3.1 TaxID=1246459 RepID=UPI00037227ED|nr:hypothetical protein [Rhizobium sp. 2MFCol3.1]
MSDGGKMGRFAPISDDQIREIMTCGDVSTARMKISRLIYERTRPASMNAEPATGDGTKALYSEETPEGSVVRLSKWPEGYVLWWDGRIAWRSWKATGERVDLTISIDAKSLEPAARSLRDACEAHAIRALHRFDVAKYLESYRYAPASENEDADCYPPTEEEKEMLRDAIDDVIVHLMAAVEEAPDQDVAGRVWDEIGTALALLDDNDVSAKARALIRAALESATRCQAPQYLGGSATPHNPGEVQS